MKPGNTIPTLSNGDFCPALEGEQGAENFQVLADFTAPFFSNFTVKLGIANVVRNGKILSLPEAAQTLNFYPTLRLTFQKFPLGPVACDASGPIKSMKLTPGTLQTTMDVQIDTMVSGNHPSFTFNCGTAPNNVFVIESPTKFFIPIIFKQFQFIAGPATTPTISIAEAHFEQVVEDPKLPTNSSASFDAVAGKSASFKIRLQGASNTNSFPGEVIVNVMSGTTLLASSVSAIPLSQFDGTGSYTVMPYYMIGAGGKAYVPQNPGAIPISMPLSIQVVPTTNSNVVAGSPYTSMSLRVHQVIAPKIGLTQINSPFASCSGANVLGITCYLAIDPNSSDISRSLSSDNFMSAVFPVPDHSYSFASSIVPQVIGTSKTGNSGTIGIYEDYNQLELKRRLGGFSRMVGLVSKSYLAALKFTRNFAVTGWTPENPTGPLGFSTGLPSKSVFTVAGSPESIPHEIGHSFGLHHLYGLDPQTQRETYDSTPVDGYDATTNLKYQFPAPLGQQAYSFMGPSGFLNGLQSGSSLLSNYWVDDFSYSSIFEYLVQPPPGDPVTIAISGVFLQSGQFIPGPSMHLLNGIVTPSVPTGDIVVSLLDNNNNTLSQAALTSNFRATVDYADGSSGGPEIVEMGAMSVVLELPYSTAATQIQVSQNNVVIQKTNLNGRLLEGLVSRIPTNAFREPKRCFHADPRAKGVLKYCENFVSIHKEILYKAVSEAQRKLDSKNPCAAVEELKELIRKIEKLTLANYSVVDSSELTQTEVIAQIRAIMKGLEKEDKNHHGKK